MARPVVGWLLIVGGLAAVVGGVGMGYIFRVLDQTEQEREQWAVVYDGRARRPTRDATPGYAAAAASVVVGGLMVAIGFGARRAPGRRRRRTGADGPARECPECGEPMSARATRCYHCAGVIRVEVERGGRGSRRLRSTRHARPRADPARRPGHAGPPSRRPRRPTTRPGSPPRDATNPTGTRPTPDRTGAYLPPGEVDRDAVAPGLIAGRYELGPELARGGMGVVHRAVDRPFDREVAIKLLSPRLVGTPAADRFLDEARITGRLQHPSIPPVHEVGVLPDGNPYLVMKLIRGRTLADEVAAAPRPSGRAEVGPAGLDDDRERDAVDFRDRLLRAFEQICLAVAFAHSRRVVHRDLKPQNVMVGAFGEVQVMDWGLAKELAAPARPDAGAAEPGDGPEDRTRVGDVVGTPAYMPPEQARGENDRVDERADVFALGGVLCAILTGAAPYQGPERPRGAGEGGRGRVGRRRRAVGRGRRRRPVPVAGAGSVWRPSRPTGSPTPARSRPPSTTPSPRPSRCGGRPNSKKPRTPPTGPSASPAAPPGGPSCSAAAAWRSARCWWRGRTSFRPSTRAGTGTRSRPRGSGGRRNCSRSCATPSPGGSTPAGSRPGPTATIVSGCTPGCWRRPRRWGRATRRRRCLVEAAMAEAANDPGHAARQWERAVEAYRADVPDHTRLVLACDAVGWFAGPPEPGRMERLILAGAVRVLAAADPAAPDDVRRRAADALAAAARVGVRP